MTYRPAGDERAVVGARAGVTKERIWINDLARYLSQSHSALRRFARKRGLMREMYVYRTGAREAYVSVYGAQRMIAYFRALQGDWYLNGQDFHAFHAGHRAANKRSQHKRSV